MKFSNLFILLGAATKFVVAEPVSEVDTVIQCADRGGLLDTTDMPKNITSHRNCAGHPTESLGLTHLTHSGNHGLTKRNCAYGSYGCQGGYCWKRCGDRGEWCWQATTNGWGSWGRCSADADCVPAAHSDWGCAQGGCGSCGCKC